MSTPVEEIKGLLADQQKAAEEARAAHTKGIKEHTERLGEIDKVLKERGEEGIELKTSFQQSTEKLVRLEEDMQKASDQLARMQSGSPEQRKSIREMLEEKAADMKSYRSGHMELLEIEGKAAAAITSATGSAGTLIQPDRETTPLLAPQPRLWLRDLLPVIPTASNAVEWVQEKSRESNAAIQTAEGAAKAQSDIDFELKTDSVKTIAHWTTQSRQVMDDAPQLAAIIEQMLRYGLNAAEEAQMLLGAGTGVNMNGIMTQATSYVSTAEVATDTRIDRIRRAILQAESALYPASSVAMNHADWAEIEMTKTDDKGYLFANPVNSTTPRLWGLPVLSAPSMTAGTFVTGGFSTGAMIYDRELTTVRIADMDQDDFIKNMVKVLVEKRVMLAVKRPASFIKGNFTFTAPEEEG